MTGDDTGKRSPRAYVTNAIDLLELHAFNRHQVDWMRTRQEALRRIDDTTSAAHTYEAIQKAIDALDSPHTLLISPQAAAQVFGGPAEQEPVPEHHLIAGQFGYLNIPEAGASDEADERYVRLGVSAMRELDACRPAGWIVDLRGNTGGNMYPMITVLAPLLGDGVLGSFVDADGHATDWRLRDGGVSVDGVPQCAVPNPYQLANGRAPIAILIGERTCSAGEATLIAFLGLPNVCTFGAPTAGLATANAAFELDDGALLVVTVAREADRTGRVYRDEPIKPDVSVSDTGHEVINSAVGWLRSQLGS